MTETMTPYEQSDSHGWNHPQCYRCWMLRWGMEREPTRVKDDGLRTCCYCGFETDAGIFIRHKPYSIDIPYCTDNTLDLTLFRAVRPPEKPAAGP